MTQVTVVKVSKKENKNILPEISGKSNSTGEILVNITFQDKRPDQLLKYNPTYDQ